MCGLFGWYLKDNATTEAERAVLGALLARDNDKRGGDSWGWWSLTEAPRYGYSDMAYGMPATEMAAHEQFFAHTRFATQGEVKLGNCHPFTVGPITGAHNGCIYNAWELDYDYPERKCRVDSMHVFEHMASDMPLAELEGYGALVVTDTRRPGEVWLGRFNDGVLTVAEFEGDVGVAWSSDKSHLVDACSQTGLAFETRNLAEGKWYKVVDGKLIRTRRRIKISRGFRPTKRAKVWYGGAPKGKTTTIRPNGTFEMPDETDITALACSTQSATNNVVRDISDAKRGSKRGKRSERDQRLLEDHRKIRSGRWGMYLDDGYDNDGNATPLNFSGHK